MSRYWHIWSVRSRGATFLIRLFSSFFGKLCPPNQRKNALSSEIDENHNILIEILASSRLYFVFCFFFSSMALQSYSSDKQLILSTNYQFCINNHANQFANIDLNIIYSILCVLCGCFHRENLDKSLASLQSVNNFVWPDLNLWNICITTIMSCGRPEMSNQILNIWLVGDVTHS